mgnify:CR=1 FL=1
MAFLRKKKIHSTIIPTKITAFAEIIQDMKIEICANSYQSAINAAKAGAHRIELCSELALGGITPSYGLLKKVMSDLSIPVRVLIRPRSGDFSFSDTEFEIMKENIELCKALGVAGIVSGVLHLNNSIDIERTHELVTLSKPMHFTFHRAFDWVKNPLEEIKKLDTIGVGSILTSGQEITAVAGISALTTWRKSTKMTIIPGGGINANNIRVFQKYGFKEVHFSASKRVQTIETPQISMQSSTHFEETEITTSDTQKIKKCIKSLSNEN